MFEHLHQDDSWDAVWKQIEDVAKLTAAVGGKHVVVIPEMWRDPATGAVLEDRNLTAEQWRKKTDGMNDLGKAMFEKYGVRAQYHPHADSHVDTEENVYRFLDGTDAEFVNLCLDTGHISYCGGDNIAIIDRAPERIGYLHLKQVDPEVRAKVEAEDLPFGEAVKLGAMTEPPRGIPDMPPLLDAIDKLGIDVFAIVEQDMYPCEVDAAAADRPAHPQLPRVVRRPVREVLRSRKTMSDLRIAVLGVGMMGADHVARITSRISGARVTVVNDYLPEKAEQSRRGDPRMPARSTTRWTPSPTATSTRCVLATPGPTHEKQLLACLEHGKPVLCEKPLTTDVGDLARGGQAGGRARQAADPGRLHAPVRPRSTQQLKALIDGGELGQPLVMHCAHRNPAVPPTFDSAMIVKDSLVHEVDVTRFLFDEEITSVQIIKPAAESRCTGRASGPADRDLPDRSRASTSTSSCSSPPASPTRCAPRSSANWAAP